MNLLVKSIGGYSGFPSPVKCTPLEITQVKSTTNSVGDLIIEKVFQIKLKFEIEWKFIKKTEVQKLISLVKSFHTEVVYEDLETGNIVRGKYFYPNDRQPIPSLFDDTIYETFALTLIQK